MSKGFTDVHPIIAAAADIYRYPSPPPFLKDLARLLSEFVRWLLNFIASIFHLMPGNTDTHAVGNIIRLILYTAGLVFALLIVRLIWSRLNELARQERLAKSTNILSTKSWDAQAWQIHATKLGKDECWQEACRAALVSVLHLLDEVGLLPFSANRTNFEYCLALTNPSAGTEKNIIGHFKSMVEIVDLCWFGNKTATESDFRTCFSDLENIRRALTPLAEIEQLPAAPEFDGNKSE